jgi:O-antigen/teichoic acid export membrane protein
MAEFVWIIPLAVEAVMLRLTTPLWVAGQREEISQLLSRVVRFMALLTGWVLLPIGMLGDYAMRIYFGEGFIEAAPALQIMVPGVFAYSLSRMLWPVLQGRGNMLPLIGVTGAAATTNIALSWFLIPLHGILGAAISVAVSYGSVVFLYSALLRKEGVHPFAGFPFWRFASIALLTSLVMLGVRYVFTSHWLIVLVGGLAASVVYWLLALRLSVLSADEIGKIIESMPGPLGKRLLPLWSGLAPVIRRISAGRPGPGEGR